MIQTKKELKFYLMADYMMNRGEFHKSFKQRVRDIVLPDKIMQYLRFMRKVAYYRRKGNIIWLYYYWRYYRIGVQLGFSIVADSLGYGLVIPHYGTIVVGRCSIGNYAVLHTSTCISGNGKTIGNGLHVSTGVKITTGRVLGDNVSIAANSVVTKSFPSANGVLLAGMPASIKSNSEAWFKRDEKYGERVRKVEELRKEMGLYL